MRTNRRSGNQDDGWIGRRSNSLWSSVWPLVVYMWNTTVWSVKMCCWVSSAIQFIAIAVCNVCGKWLRHSAFKKCMTGSFAFWNQLFTQCVFFILIKESVQSKFHELNPCTEFRSMTSGGKETFMSVDTNICMKKWQMYSYIFMMLNIQCILCASGHHGDYGQTAVLWALSGKRYTSVPWSDWTLFLRHVSAE